jgi:hypothetical protein
MLDGRRSEGHSSESRKGSYAVGPPLGAAAAAGAGCASLQMRMMRVSATPFCKQ